MFHMITLTDSSAGRRGREIKFAFATHEELQAFRQQAKARKWMPVRMTPPEGVRVDSVESAIAELERFDAATKEPG